MEYFRKLILQTRQYLTGLNTSQRLAIGACAAAMGLSMLWLISWAGSAEMVPLLDQRLTAAEVGRITQVLDAERVRYRVTGDMISVPSADRARLQARLAQQNALPEDISIGFDKLIADSSPWLSADEQSWRRAVAKGNELSKVLRNFDGVRDARVFLDVNVKRRIDQPAVQPTASVFVKLAPGTEMTRERVFGIASFVARAVPGLLISNVGVTDAVTGVSHSVPRPEDTLAFDDLDDRQKKERYFADRIRELLNNIPGLRVAVHAELNPELTRITREEHGKPVPTRERTENTESSEVPPSGEPGVVSNVTPNAPVAAGGSRTEKSLSEVTYDARADSTRTTIERPRHGLVSLSVAVNVPRSYLAAIYRKSNEGREPSDQELAGFAGTADTMTKIQNMVQGILPAAEQAESKVTVAWFHDDASIAFADVMQAGVPAGMIDYVRTYGGQAGLGALALLSLLLMLLMVRRVGEGPVLPGEEPPEPRGLFGRKTRAAQPEMEEFVASPPVGEAAPSDQLLVGMEVDEKTLHTQKIIDQVADMVKDDPQMSASILQRWIELAKK